MIIPNVLTSELGHEFHYSLEANAMRIAQSVRFGSPAHDPAVPVDGKNYFITTAPRSLIRLEGASRVDADAFHLMFSTAAHTPASSAGATPIQLVVPAISQIPHEVDATVARQFCGPVCLSMCAEYFGVRLGFDRARTLCFSRPTGKYGSWHQLTWAAQVLGLSAATLVIHNEVFVSELLADGCLVIASLRFGSGELPGFPFGSSAGHLVVVTGISGDSVTINDPAHAMAVEQRYPLELFMRVWQQSRAHLGGAVGVVLWTPPTKAAAS